MQVTQVVWVHLVAPSLLSPPPGRGSPVLTNILANTGYFSQEVNSCVLACPTVPAAPRELPGYPREGVPNQVGCLPLKVMPFPPAAHVSLNEGVSRLGTDPVVLALRFSLLPAPCGGEGKAWEVSLHGRQQVQTLSTKTFLSAVLHPHSASSGAWGENAVV